MNSFGKQINKFASAKNSRYFFMINHPLKIRKILTV